MSELLSQAEIEAADWVIRSRAAAFDAWAELTDWMEAQPANAEAFNRLMLRDAAIADLLHERAERQGLLAANDDDRPQHRRRMGYAALGAMAAALALAVFVWPRGPMIIETGPGELREVTLADGVTASLNGDTRLEYDRGDPRAVRLVRGEALFDVRHGTGKPMEVTAGSLVMRDLGTTFDVIHSPTQTSLAVAQGTVLFDARGAALPVLRGEGAARIKGSAQVVRFALPDAAVAGWRTGRLVYRDAGAVQIAEDLSRRLGVPVAVAQRAQELRFTGTISTGADAGQAVARAAALIGAQAVKTQAGWRLDAAD